MNVRLSGDRALPLVSAALAGGCSGTAAGFADPVAMLALAAGALALWGTLRWRRRAAVRAALDAAGLALLTLDTRLRVRHVSAAARPLLAPALRARRPLLEACPALENGPLHRALQRATDGETVTVEDCGALCAGPTRGRVRRVGRRLWVALEDDAERRRSGAALRAAEHALREDRQRLAFAVEAAGVGLWEWELGSERVRYSRGWKRLLGYEDDEIVDEFGEWRRLVHPDDAAPTLERVAAYLDDPRAPFQTEFRMRHRDGGWRWILSTSALRPERHGVRYLLGAHVDITARKQAETALAASEANLRRVVDGLGPNMFVALLDLEGTVHWVNRSVLDASGEPAGTFIGRPFTDAPAWQNDPAGRARMADAIRTAAAGRALRFDLEVEAAAGQRLWLDNCLQLLPEADGSANWLLVSATDITARKQAEQDLREAATRLRRLAKRLVAGHDAEQRRFSAELHDRIGQNLTALGVGLELLAASGLDADARAVRLRDARRLLERTTSAVRDLITELRPPGLDEYGLLAGLRCLAEDTGRSSGLRIVAHGQEPCPRLPPAHETVLFRIAQEAVANAVRHAGARRIELSLAADADGPLLRVADDGEGFDPARVARGHWGLEIMRERATSIGAHLRVLSAPGRGTCVTVGFGPPP